jgi:hypothetical protein
MQTPAVHDGQATWRPGSPEQKRGRYSPWGPWAKPPLSWDRGHDGQDAWRPGSLER